MKREPSLRPIVGTIRDDLGNVDGMSDEQILRLYEKTRMDIYWVRNAERRRLHRLACLKALAQLLEMGLRVGSRVGGELIRRINTEKGIITVDQGEGMHPAVRPAAWVLIQIKRENHTILPPDATYLATVLQQEQAVKERARQKEERRKELEVHREKLKRSFCIQCGGMMLKPEDMPISWRAGILKCPECKVSPHIIKAADTRFCRRCGTLFVPPPGHGNKKNCPQC